MSASCKAKITRPQVEGRLGCDRTTSSCQPRRAVGGASLCPCRTKILYISVCVPVCEDRPSFGQTPSKIDACAERVTCTTRIASPRNFSKRHCSTPARRVSVMSSLWALFEQRLVGRQCGVPNPSSSRCRQFGQEWFWMLPWLGASLSTCCRSIAVLGGRWWRISLTPASVAG